MLLERPSEKFEYLVCSHVDQVDPDLRAAHEDFRFEILLEREQNRVVVDDPLQLLLDYHLTFVGKGTDEESNPFCPTDRWDRGASLLN